MEYIEKFLQNKGGFTYYDKLNNVERQIYDLLLYGFTNFKLKMTFNNVSDEKVQEILHYVLYDHPYIFYISQEFLMTCLKSSVTFTFDLKYSKREIKVINKKINKKIKKIVKNIKSKAKNKYQEILMLNTYICKNIARHDQFSFSFEDGHIVGVLLNNKARCEGISKFASIILRILGHEVSMVHGYAWENNSRKVRHAWNLLRIDDNYYHMDFSYDLSYSSSSFVCKSFLFLTDEEIFKNHKYQKDIGYPKCTDESFNYFRINKQVVSTNKDYVNIRKNVYGKQVIIEYKYNYDISERQLESSLQNIIVNNLKVDNWIDVVYRYVDDLNDVYLLVTLR